jgi:Rad3-related DNA helicase
MDNVNERSLDYLRRMSDFYSVKVPDEQSDYAGRCMDTLLDGRSIILVADGGLGKTIGYLVPGMMMAKRHNMPLIVVSSNITNRDQIVEEHAKIMGFDQTIENGIGMAPMLLYRSARDYVDPERVRTILACLKDTNIPQRVIMDLQRILDTIKETGSTLLDDVFPDDIIIGPMNDQRVIVSRNDIAMSPSDITADNHFAADRESIKAVMDTGCVLVVTMVMLAQSHVLRKAIKEGRVVAVVVDECDRLLNLDYVTRLTLSFNEIGGMLESLIELDFDIGEAAKTFQSMRDLLDGMRITDHVMINRKTIGQEKTDLLIGENGLLDTFARQVGVLAAEYDKMEFDGIDWKDETQRRRVGYMIDGVIGTLEDVVDFHFQYNTSSHLLHLDTGCEMFAHTTEGDTQISVVPSTPGRSIKWLFYAGVPVILTTAFLGIEHDRFAAQIGLAKNLIHPRSAEIRALQFGHLIYTYFSNLRPPVVDGAVSPLHFDDVAAIIRCIYKMDERMLVLTPGYRDIEQIVQRLEGINVPFYIHRRGTNINLLRQTLIQKPGILLTVYWEGFNIVGDGASGRRGLVDDLVITRLPFPRPNPLLKAVIRHHFGDRADGWIHANAMSEVTRRVYQGSMRGLRGPQDKCRIVFCDDRIAPPKVVMDECPLMKAVIRRGGGQSRSYAPIANAIPTRFRYDFDNFDVRDDFEVREEP